jgi:hypothetical protein
MNALAPEPKVGGTTPALTRAVALEQHRNRSWEDSPPCYQSFWNIHGFLALLF